MTHHAALRRGATATRVAAMYFVAASLPAFVFLGAPFRVRGGVGIGLGVDAVFVLTT